jgi:NACHT domain
VARQLASGSTFASGSVPLPGRAAMPSVTSVAAYSAGVWQSARVNRAKRPGGQHLLAAARHPARRDGVIALAPFLLPWAALVQVGRHHLDTGTMVAVISALATAGISLSTLWLTWAALREAKRSGGRDSGLTIGQMADQLAIAVGKQWADEAAIRRLNDPYPLPVSWTAADSSLTDSWDSLLKLAGSGAGWPAAPPAGTWAAGPDCLAGEGGDLAEVLAQVPTGRLVVLGEPGAAKTMLMVRLVLGLLARRAAGDPVPFLASIASWNPEDQDLRGWLAAQLLIAHPALASPPSADMAESTLAATLLASGLILPILDGLDEIPEKVRGSSISRINDALGPGQRVVVTCRSKEYREAVRPEDGPEATFRAAAVQLRPLTQMTSAPTSTMMPLARLPKPAGYASSSCSAPRPRPGRH